MSKGSNRVGLEAHYDMKVYERPNEKSGCLLGFRGLRELLVAELYRKRWTLETAFQHLEAYFHSEINTLGYPKAALFGFCLALVAYNLLAVVLAALRGVHGEETVDQEVSLTVRPFFSGFARFCNPLYFCSL
jgi:hypothetical protein